MAAPLPSDEASLGLLRQAGYSVEDPSALPLAQSAYSAAYIVALSAAQGSQPGSAAGTPRPGRNAPCPCGSGKKYKKCCLGSGGAAGTTASPGGPSTRARLSPRLIPRLFDHQALPVDLERLGHLLESDPVLASVGLSPARAGAFLEKALAGQPEGVPERLPPNELLDDLSQRYLAEVEGRETIARLGQLLRTAGKRHAHDDDALRSLALGVLLSQITSLRTPQDDANGEPDLLASLLFRRALRQWKDSGDRLVDSLDALARPLRGSVDLTKLANSTEPDDALRALAESLSPEQEQMVRGLVDRKRDTILDSMRHGGFPVPLSLASAVVLIEELLPGGALDCDWSPEEMANTVADLADTLTEEDWRLYCGQLERALANPDQLEPAERSDVLTALGLLRSGETTTLQPFDFPLLLRAMADWLRAEDAGTGRGDGLVSGLEGYELADGDSALEPEGMEEYAAQLDEAGYRGLAGRVRRFAGRVEGVGVEEP